MVAKSTRTLLPWDVDGPRAIATAPFPRRGKLDQARTVPPYTVAVSAGIVTTAPLSAAELLGRVGEDECCCAAHRGRVAQGAHADLQLAAV